MRSDNRSGNVWVYRFRDGFRVYFRVGGRMNGTRTYRTQAEAEEEGDRMIRAEITMRSRSVRTAFDAFKKEMGARSVGDATIERVERDGVRLLAPVIDEPLAALTSRRAESLYTAIATSGDFAAGTHQMSLKVSKAFGAWCAHPRRRWLRENPFAAVEKLGKVADHRSESLRVNEARAFRDKAIEFASCRGDDGALAALLALITSLRPSEIVQLAARDVDDGGAILVDRRRQGQDSQHAPTHRDRRSRAASVARERCSGKAADREIVSVCNQLSDTLGATRSGVHRHRRDQRADVAPHLRLARGATWVES